MNAVEFIRQLGTEADIAENLVWLVGVSLLGIWLFRTNLGTKALAGSRARRNGMPFFLPLIPLFAWFGIVAVVVMGTSVIFGDAGSRRGVFFNNLGFCVGGIATACLCGYLMRASFARGLRGAGLDVRTIGRDAAGAVLNLLSVWPVVIAAVALTIRLGSMIYGAGYEIPQHEELKLIEAYERVDVRIVIIVLTVLIAPVVEEMIFRGLFQTLIRTQTGRPWISILLTSVVFAMVHAQFEHWPALFVLAVCLGYSYEKSGSLFRPILIHSFFNAFTVVGVLSG